MVVVDRYGEGKIGPAFRQTLKLLRKGVSHKDDDVILVIAGLTGSGKSNLGMITYEELTDDVLIDQIALTREDFARALKNASTHDGFRYVQYDEGKLNRREWQSEWSRELLEIYHDIRGLNIFHVWCTAYPELLDQVFVTERVKGFVFIYTKDISRPRRFLYFTKQDLMRFLEKNEKITIRSLKKHGKAHASIDSWFKPYDGVLREAYLEKKKNRMTERVHDFYAKWGAGSYSNTDVARELNVSDRTVINWARKLLRENVLQEGEHYVVLGSGITRFTEGGLALLRDFSEKRVKKNSLVSVSGGRSAFRGV